MNINRWVIFGAAFALGAFAGVEFAKYYAVNKTESTVDPEITKVFGSGYVGQIRDGRLQFGRRGGGQLSLGTLAATGIFSPGDVKNEAVLLHTATLALALQLNARIAAASQDLLAAWDAFVSDEKDFYARAQSFLYFVDFADNSTRDQVLALEARYNAFAPEVAALPADPDALDASSTAADLPDFSDPSTRTAHDLLAEPGGPVSELGGLAQKALDEVKSIGWPLIGAAVLVVGVVGLVLVNVARSGAVKVGV